MQRGKSPEKPINFQDASVVIEVHGYISQSVSLHAVTM